MTITFNTMNRALLALPGDVQKRMEEAEALFRAEYMRFIEQTFREALIAKLGEFPHTQELKKHAFTFHTPGGVVHLAWLDEPLKPGDRMDPSTILASVAPPKFKLDLQP